MFKALRHYFYVIVVVNCFLANMLAPGMVMAQSSIFDNRISTPQVLEDLNKEPIADQSQSGDLNQQIAPAPLVITTSSGDVFLVQGGSVKAAMSVNDKGTLETTYSIGGAKYLMKNEFGETFNYVYDADGRVVNVVNSAGEIVSTSKYELGLVQSFAKQGKITYQYDDAGKMTSSTDDWGNVTMYDAGKPTQIIDSTGKKIGDYKYNGDILVSFTDHTGSTTYFDTQGIRPNYTTNAQGTTTQVYEYDTDGHLLAVVNVTNGQTTTVDKGYYTSISVANEETGAPVLTGVYNYNADKTVSSITDIAENGVITGWSVYDDLGKVIESYNADGSLVQQYEYNDHGFLNRTVSLGSIDPLTGKQAVTSYTLFDANGRPSDVWQVGDGANVVKIQEYAYKANGLLDVTYSLGIRRDDAGNAVMTNGDFDYFKTGVTTYDAKARPNQVLNLVYDDQGNAVMIDGKQVSELSQKYAYSAEGFLASTISYGMNGTMNGRTEFDVYSRPEVSYNAQGAVNQLYTYASGEGKGYDGFLKETRNYGENGVETGYTVFDAKGKPTEVFNHLGSIVQKYEYDQNGLLVKSWSLNGTSADGTNTILATQADKNKIAALWNLNSWDDIMSQWFLAAYDTTDGVSVEASLLNDAWGFLDAGDSWKALALSLKVIQLYSGEATAQQKKKNSDPNSTETWALDAVGAAYIILAKACEQLGDQASAVSAYKVAGGDFSKAQVNDPAQGITWNVGDAAKTALGTSGVSTGVVTGYTLFGGDSRPIASYKYFDNGSGVQATKQQDYVYSYDKTVKDADGNEKLVTAFSSFVQKTVNYGNFGSDGKQVVTGFTLFDNYGRQSESFNESYDDNGVKNTPQLVQKYNYSKQGFLDTIGSYGLGKTLTGMTVFDDYSRPVAAFNATGNGKIPDDVMSALTNGITPEDVNNPTLQPYLKGLTQTFEYGADGFLSVSKSWGEADAFLAQDIGKFMTAMGSVKGDKAYNAAFDFATANADGSTGPDGKIDAKDLALLNSKMPGISDFASALGSKQGDANYKSQFDFDQNGLIDKTDQSAYLKTLPATAYYAPTYTGETHYDKWGNASVVKNAQGYDVQKYVYDDRGFMTRSDSYAAMTDENGNVNTYVDAAGVTQPVMIRTGYTEFDAYSRPNATYSVFKNGTAPEQEALAQTYKYDLGFLTRTYNKGDVDANGTPTEAGYTDFDKFGRQTASYNDAGKLTTSFVYSKQGFLASTNNYGIDKTFLGKTVFSKEGRPTEAYNWTNDGTSKGLTQTFTYNKYGFLESSKSYGEDQIVTGTTIYGGYGKPIRVENDKGIAVSSYEYNDRGFMTKTLSLAFVEDAAAANPVTVTNTDGQTKTGYFAVTGYTVFDALSRPTDSYQCYWNTPTDANGSPQGAKVQSYAYQDGFVVGTNNFGRNGADLGYTTFDKFGRQATSANEFDEITTKFSYSKQGFLNSTINYGADKAVVGKTTFNALGRPEAAYNQSGALVQTFKYDGFSSQLELSESFGALNDQGAPTKTGETEYDAFGKATKQYQISEGPTGEPVRSLVSLYEYDNAGFMNRTLSLGDNQVLTGFTAYDDAGRPTSSYSVYNYAADPYTVTASSPGVAKVQDFVYNTNATGKVADAQYIGNVNTGFLRSTINYGDNQTVIGSTQFNNFGQQTKSYNEYDEQTTAYQYSKQGFLSATLNYGLDKTMTGKTVFNNYGRPTEAFNERGALVQKFNYNERGFLASSTSYGAPDANGKPVETGKTTYDEYGKQLASFNPEGMVVSSYEYNDKGFLTRSNNLAFLEAPDGTDTVQLASGESVKGWYKTTGYTVYNDASRPVESYSSYGWGAASNDTLTQKFVYEKTTTNKDGTTTTSPTGFITGTNNYTLNSALINPADGTLLQAAGTTNASGGTTLSAIGTEVLFAGSTTYNKYGRPDQSFNEAGQLISRNMYSNLGFISSSVNYGQDKTVTGKLIYDISGRPSYAQNHTGAKTTEYFYNKLGMLDHTLGYQESGVVDTNSAPVVTSRTEFDVFSKATKTYQLFNATEAQTPNGSDVDGNGTTEYVYNPSGLVTNYANGGAEGGTPVQTNIYNAFGYIMRTESLGRLNAQDFQPVTSTIYYDSFSRPTEVINEKGFQVQGYHYNDAGFLDYTTSYNDGTPTSRTMFNKLGQQSATFLLTAAGEVGAKQVTYEYNKAGFLLRTSNWNDTTKTGTTEFDLSGRQTYSKNPEGKPVSWFYYDKNGFLAVTSSMGFPPK